MRRSFYKNSNEQSMYLVINGALWSSIVYGVLVVFYA